MMSYTIATLVIPLAIATAAYAIIFTIVILMIRDM